MHTLLRSIQEQSSLAAEALMITRFIDHIKGFQPDKAVTADSVAVRSGNFFRASTTVLQHRHAFGRTISS